MYTQQNIFADDHNYRKLLKIRSTHPALHAGSLEIIPTEQKSSQLLAYVRSFEDEKILILINWGDKKVSFDWESAYQQEIFSFGEIDRDNSGRISLGPYASSILRN